VSDGDLETARAALGERLYPLFASMQAADQRHCLDVYEHLAAEGCEDAEVLQAALLHDAGKGRIAGARFGVHHRVAYVVMEGLSPVIDWLARRNHGLASLHHHGPKTVALVREFGGSAGLVQLLEEVEGLRPKSERARRLKAADDAS
jgi:hypothetical protein